MNKRFEDLHYPVKTLPKQLGENYQQMYDISKATAEMSLESLWYYLSMVRGTIDMAFDGKYRYKMSNNQFVIIVAQSGRGKDTSGMFYKGLINSLYADYRKEVTALKKIVEVVEKGLTTGKNTKVVELSFPIITSVEDPSIKSPTMEAINLRTTNLTAYNKAYSILWAIVNDDSNKYKVARLQLKTRDSDLENVKIFDLVNEFVNSCRYINGRTIVGARNTELSDFISSMSKSEGGLSSLIPLYEYEVHSQDRATSEFSRQQYGNSALTFTLYGQHEIVKEQLSCISPFSGGRQRIRMVYIPADNKIEHNNTFHITEGSEMEREEKKLLRYLSTLSSKHLIIDDEEMNKKMAEYQRYISKLIEINIRGMYSEEETAEIVNSYSKRYFGNYFFKFVVDHCILWNKDKVDNKAIHDAFLRTVYHSMMLVYYIRNYLTDEKDGIDKMKTVLIGKIEKHKTKREIQRSFSKKQQNLLTLLDTWLSVGIAKVVDGQIKVNEERAMESENNSSNNNLSAIEIPECKWEYINDEIADILGMFEKITINQDKLDYSRVENKEEDKKDYDEKIDGICSMVVSK